MLGNSNNNVIDFQKKSNLSKKKIERIIESFLEFYEKNYKKPNKFYKGWVILCPFHNDTNPSLALYKDGSTWCFSCEKIYKIEAVLRSYGFWEGEFEEDPELKPDFTLIEQKQDWVITNYKQYFYTDGERFLIRVRIDFENTQTRERRKAFYFYQPVIKNGEQVLELVKGRVPLILYRLPELEDKEKVFFVEGEKCTDALWDLGLPATTLPVGASIKPSKDLYKALIHLKGKTVYILPDNDEAGWQYAKTIQQVLSALEIKSQIIPVPRLGDKSDIADFIEIESLKGQTKEEIKEEILSWCKPKEKVIPFWEAMKREKEKGLDKFLVPGLLPAKGLGLLVGRSKLGKTELLCLIVSKLLKGESLFDRPSEKVKVLWITQEDTKFSIGIRLMMRGITPEELQTNLFTEEVGEEATIPKEVLIEEAQRLGCQMVIVEPLLAIKELAELGIKDKLTYGAVYSVLLPLKKKAEETGIFVLGVHHTTKGKAVFKDWVDVIDGTLGSSAFAGVPDCIIGIGLTSSGDQSLRRVLAKGRGVMMDYLIEWVWEELKIQEERITFGKYIEKGEYSFEFDLTPGQKRLVDAIKELGENATPKRLAEYLGKTEGAVKMMLGELIDKGVVVRTKRGNYSVSKKQKETYFPYFTYFAYFAYLTYFDAESKGRSDRLPYFQSLEISGLEAKVRKVSKVSLTDLTPSTQTPTLTQDQTPTSSFVPTLNQEPQAVEETQVKEGGSLMNANDGSFLNCYNRHLNEIYVMTQEELQPQFWIVRIKNTICPKCGDEHWKIRVNPYENEGALVFGECLNCNFERTVDLRDFETIKELCGSAFEEILF